MRKLSPIGLLLALFVLGGCSLFGLFGERGPQTFTIFFSTETEGELKPCG
ncbi:MAG: hypothetical protein FJY73_09140 [Candidatus Eisenbacteria bacterium]|nr:hypothetical protein [Candidatus Eisenbacteria bacterium]